VAEATTAKPESLKRTSMRKKAKTAAVVRGGEWDTTQAAPRTVRTLRDIGFRVTILCWDFTGKKPAREFVDGFEVIRYQRKIGQAGVKFMLSWPFWWIWLLRQFFRGKFDFLHVMNLDCVVPAVLSRCMLGHKIVYDIRDAWGLCLSGFPFPIPQFFTLLDHIFSALVDGILLSQGDVKFCAAYHGYFAARRVPVIQVLNVPEKDFGGSGYQPPDGQPMRINYSGRISSLRGAEQLMKIVGKSDDLRLHVYGKCTNSNLQEKLKNADNVDFDEQVPFEKAIEYLDADDVVSLLYDPSQKVVFVASANKMFEAMMMGKPYICTHGSYPAIVAERYQLGWPVDYCNPTAVEALLHDLAANPQKRIEAGQNGRRAYETNFRWSQQRENLERLYRYLLRDFTIQPRKTHGWSLFIGTVS